jgi:hypothetical protein
MGTGTAIRGTNSIYTCGKRNDTTTPRDDETVGVGGDEARSESHDSSRLLK